MAKSPRLMAVPGQFSAAAVEHQGELRVRKHVREAAK
jgi:hypothetical protein